MEIDKIKIVYIISNINKALAFEWIATEINKNKVSLSFILLNPGNSELENFLKVHNLPVIRISYTGKKDLVKTLIKLGSIFRAEKPDIIHTHLFDASLIGLLAGKLAGIKKRVYTRHHSSLHHVYYPRAVYYDRVINYLATDIVSITNKVSEILVNQEGVDPNKIKLIHHGFKLDGFSSVDESLIISLRKKYNPNNNFPVIGSIARYTHWKGIQYTIEAFKKLLIDYPNALLLLAGAVGDFAIELRKTLSEIPAKNFVEIPFENDIMALYQLMDVYVHVPIDDHSEAFGQTYVEALAAGIPSVFTKSGVAAEFIEDRKNALVVPFKNSDAIFRSIKEILEDEGLRNSLINQGKKDVVDKFNLSKMISSLEKLYEG